ncbi:MAG TPA: NADH-quinone oxidoreductase subunit C [Verrucomicrobiae bacterium]|nr:NADH-quinone oxidoreductase subunit C [Verrucomicrobiae bacterium]
MIPSLEEIKNRIETALPGTRLEILRNESPSGQHSLLVRKEDAAETARFLRNDPSLSLDYCSNVTGVDWPETELTQKVKIKTTVDGVEKEVEETRKTKKGGYLEVVYHLYSMEKKHGPVILRMRTENRADKTHLPSLTPLWRSCEFQEREIYDLYGVVFDGHPDLRRILMWDGFQDHPMRRDYVAPDDYEYEPTTHSEVLERAKRHG